MKKLADIQLEQLPDEGVGTLKRKSLWADIAGSRLTPEELFENFRRDFNEATPGVVDAAASPGTRHDLDRGETITMSLPLRGNFHVRVEELTPCKATLVTLKGHPLAGAVRFLSEARGGHLRFEVQMFDRPASIPDWLAMRTVGRAVQGRTWKSLVEKMVDESGGAATNGIEEDEHDLDENKADLIDGWLRELILERKRLG